jgi:hypothetical protein
VANGVAGTASLPIGSADAQQHVPTGRDPARAGPVVLPADQEIGAPQMPDPIPQTQPALSPGLAEAVAGFIAPLVVR